jgi:hypothetical protein
MTIKAQYQPLESSSDVLGAYGFSFQGACGPLLTEFPPSWPSIELCYEATDPHSATARLGESSAEFPYAGGGSVLVNRYPRTGTYRFPRPLNAHELTHPYLVSVAATHAYWHGYETFHAGAFISGGRAWVVLAERHGGKSSTLAALATAGYPIVSDDLVVTDHELAFAGPRSVDLREDSAQRFPEARELGMVGYRPRWRLDPGEVPPETPLGGWLFLEWGDRVETESVEPRTRLRRLAVARALRGDVRQPSRLIELAAHSMWLVRRPQSWDCMSDVMNQIRGLTA